ncbi:hypothetical protein VTL71DRAFT_10578, partial [Oculimacula yallundae]
MSVNILAFSCTSPAVPVHWHLSSVPESSTTRVLQGASRSQDADPATSQRVRSGSRTMRDIQKCMAATPAPG